ncbi:MAG: DUF1318 domain-containing protein [Spirochaetota bacterium]
MAHRLYYSIMIMCVFLVILSGCSSTQNCMKGMPSCIEITPPDINLTGERTVIERQVIGDYRELEKDAWIVSSAQTSVAHGRSQQVMVTGDEVLFRALKIREFHREKIREFKDKEAVGEGNDGLLYYRQNSYYEKNPEQKKQLQVLLDEENRARETIFKRSVSTVKEKNAELIQKFASRFAEEQRAMAQKGDWIQLENGRWVKKK